jgi:hypothetical protein
MPRWKVVLPILALIQFLFGEYINESDYAYLLTNQSMAVHISKKTGNITAIVLGNTNILSGDAEIIINTPAIQSQQEVKETYYQDYYPDSAVLYVNKEYANFFINNSYIIDHHALRWNIEILYKNGGDQEADITFCIPSVKTISHYFFPSADTLCSTDHLQYETRRFRKNMLLPAISLLNSQKNFGLTIFSPFDIPKPQLLFTVDRKQVMISYRNLWFGKEKKAKGALYITPHQCDWRPGLNILINKYPEYFYPSASTTAEGEGWFYEGSPFDDENTIRRIREYNVKWIEMHGYFPFYGLYAPDQKDWCIIMNSDKVSYDAWIKGLCKKDNSYEKMRQSINLWHKYGIQVYLYLQSFESWHQYAKRYFGENIARNKKGNPLSAWKLCNLMNPDPKNEWGKHIIDQAKSLIKKYPNIDGIFYDRMDYWNYDYAHYDSKTMKDGQKAYMLGFAQEEINAKLFKIFHTANKGIWGNNPASIDICKHLDGIMAESDPVTLQKMQYLCLVRPLIYYPKDRIPIETENKLKWSLLCGAFPAITHGNSECQNLDSKYDPLFQIIRNRKWVLTSKPLAISGNLKSNIFATSAGNYAITLVSSEKFQSMHHPFEYDIPLRINIPDADQINFGYLLSGDWSGVNNIDIKKDSNTILVNLPYHLSNSLIYLTREETYETVRLSSPMLIRDSDCELAFRLKNYKPTNLHSFEISTPWKKITLDPTSEIVRTKISVPAHIKGEIEMTIRYNNSSCIFSFWVISPVTIAPLENIFVHNRDGEDIPFYITNNTGEVIQLHTKGTYTEGAGYIKNPSIIKLEPFETKMENFFLCANNDGTIQISSEYNHTVAQSIYEVKTRIPFSKSDLFRDNFMNGMEKWDIIDGKWSVANKIATGSGNSHLAIIQDNDWHDYIYEISLRCRGSEDLVVNWLKSYMFFRVQNSKNFYRFGIHGDGRVVDLYKCIDGKWTYLAASSFIPVKDKWYTLKIHVEGNHFIGYIDGNQILEVQDTEFSTGGVGFGVLEDGMICEYRDVIVKQL